MFILALHFAKAGTLRVLEVAGALTAIGGAALFLGAITPMARRFGQLSGGLALAVAGVLIVLAERYGVT